MVAERTGREGLYDIQGRSDGTLLVLRRGQVLVVGISGGAIRALQVAGTWTDVLLALYEFPHRVTLLDAAYDVPINAPPALDMLQSGSK